MKALLVAAAGLIGGFVSTLASNGSAVTLPALEFLGLPEHVANGTNRLSVVALGLVGAASFYRRGLVDWVAGVPLALGSAAGAYLASRLATREWARIWIYRFFVLVVILAIVQFLIVDTQEFLGPCGPFTHH